MKKLLTVSVLAIMAVSTANAEIASTGYVDKQTGAVDGVFAAGSFTNAAAEATNLKDAVNAIAGAVGTTNANLDALDGSFTDPGVVTSITQTDGKVTATLKKITDDEVDSISKDKITGLGALATRDTVTQAQVEGLTTALDSKQGTIADLETIRDGAALGATSLQDSDVATSITEDEAQAGKLATSGLVAQAIADSESTLDNELAAINDTLEEIPNTYATITYVNNEDDKIEAVIGSGFTSDSTVASQLSAVKATADGAVQSVGAGTANGTISVDGADVAVTGLTAVASMELPTECEKGAATCALVYDPTVAGKLKWEAIMK